MAKLKSKSRHKASTSLSHIECSTRRGHGGALSLSPTEASPSSSAGGSPILTRAISTSKGKRRLDTPATDTFFIDDGYHSSSTDSASAATGSLHRPLADLRRHKRARIGGSRPTWKSGDWTDLVDTSKHTLSGVLDATLADEPKLNEAEEEILKLAALADLHLQSPLVAEIPTYEEGDTTTATYKEAPRQLQLVQKIRLEARSSPSISHQRTQSSVNLQALHASPHMSAHHAAHMHLRALMLPDRVRANGGTLIDAETLLLLSRGRSQSDSLVRSQKVARSQRGHGRTVSMPEGMLLALQDETKDKPNYQTAVEEASEDELEEDAQDEDGESDWLDDGDDTSEAEAQDDNGEEESQAGEVSDWETVCSEMPRKAGKPSLSRRKQWRKAARGSMRSRRRNPETGVMNGLEMLHLGSGDNTMYDDNFLDETLGEHDIARIAASAGLGGSFRPLGRGGSVSEPVRLTFSLARIHAPIVTVQAETQETSLEEAGKNDNDSVDEEIVIEVWIVDETPSIPHEHEHEQPFFHDFDAYPGALQEGDNEHEHGIIFEDDEQLDDGAREHEREHAAPTCFAEQADADIEGSEHWYDDDEMWDSSETEGGGRFEELGDMADDGHQAEAEVNDEDANEEGWEDATDDGNYDDEDAQMGGPAPCLTIYDARKDNVRSGRTHPSRADMMKMAMLIDAGVIDEAPAMQILGPLDGSIELPAQLARMQLGPTPQSAPHADSNGPVDPYALLEMYGDAFYENEDGEDAYDGVYEYFGEEDCYDELGIDVFPPGYVVSPFAGLVRRVMPYCEDVYYGPSIKMEGDSSSNERAECVEEEDAIVEEDAAIPRSMKAVPSNASHSTWQTVYEYETLAEYDGRIYRAERGLPDDGRGLVGLHGCRPRSARDRRLGCWKRLKEVV